MVTLCCFCFAKGVYNLTLASVSFPDVLLMCVVVRPSHPFSAVSLQLCTNASIQSLISKSEKIGDLFKGQILLSFQGCATDVPYT